MSKNLFPDTAKTWMGLRLAQGMEGRRDVEHHLMEVYRKPLEVFFRSRRQSWLGEATDVTTGFFISRLQRESFFADWESSGISLRRWLLNGFCFYLKELARKKQRESRGEALVGDVPDTRNSAEEEFDRAFARSIVRRALATTRELCEAKDLETHWRVFRRHYYDGEAYAEICAALEISATRAATMARTVAGKFRSTLRELLAIDGASADRVEVELLALLEVTQSR